MTGTYFPYYMKGVLREAQEDIHQILSALTDVGTHKTPVSLSDVPLIIKALELQDPQTRDLARKTLSKLAGSDFGTACSGWEKWWAAVGSQLHERHRIESDIEDMFGRFKSAIMRGKWTEAEGLLLLGDVTYDNAAAWLEGHRKDIRRAYRDAAIEHIELGADQAAIRIRWGEYGYSMNEVGVRRTEGGWRFTSIPWEDIAIETGSDDSHIKSFKHSQTNITRLRIDEGHRQLQEEGKPFARKTKHLALGLAALSGILIGIRLMMYLATGRDPKIASSMAYLGLFPGAIYSVFGVSVVLSRKPGHRLAYSLVFLGAAVVLLFVIAWW